MVLRAESIVQKHWGSPAMVHFETSEVSEMPKLEVEQLSFDFPDPNKAPQRTLRSVHSH